MNEEQFKLDCEECRSYVEDAFMMALDDDYPDTMERCSVYVMDTLNTDDCDYADSIVNKIMGF